MAVIGGDGGRYFMYEVSYCCDGNAFYQMDMATSYGVGFIIEIIIFSDFIDVLSFLLALTCKNDVIDVPAPFSDECCELS